MSREGEYLTLLWVIRKDLWRRKRREIRPGRSTEETHVMRKILLEPKRSKYQEQ